MASNSSKNSDYGVTWGPGVSSPSNSGSGGGGSSNKSGSASSGSGSGSGGSSGSGYAYVDKYGYSHVVKDYDTAKNYASDGNVYNYSGSHKGGYAYDADNYRVPLDLPGSKPYGNDLKNEIGYNYVPKAGSLGSMFTGKLGGIASAPSLTPLLGTNNAQANNATTNNSLAPLATLAPIGGNAATGNAANKEPWEISLENFKTDSASGYKEIERAQQVYNQKMASGDYTGAQAAHHWANQIRDAMGVGALYDRTTGALLNSNTPNLYTDVLSGQNVINDRNQNIYDTTMEWLNTWKEEQEKLADALPTYNPPEREEFRFTTPPVNISSSGDDIHIPTLAARQQWENEQNAIQDRYAQQYGVNYNRAQDVYNTQLDWLKAGMAETQRQEDATREAARYQEEQAIAQEEQRWNRAWAMLEAGVPTAEVYATLGVEPGTKTFEQIMSEKAAELNARKVALSGSSGGGGGGSSQDPPYYLDTQGERANVMTGGLLERADAQYELNRQRGGNAEQYPLYYTLNTLFNNSDWRKAITSSGADVKTVADYLITKYARMSPEEYFQTGKAAGTSVAAAYKQLLNQSERDNY
jgi:hypothetical protein